MIESLPYISIFCLVNVVIIYFMCVKAMDKYGRDNAYTEYELVDDLGYSFVCVFLCFLFLFTGLLTGVGWLISLII